jgi:hypothetical protein
MLIGRGAATQIWTALEERDLHAGVRQCASGREACEPAADDGDL